MPAKYYDREGWEIDHDTWVAMVESPWAEENKRVRSTYLVDRRTGISAWVSTVWLGLDHNFLRTGPPMIFETMIFGKEWDGPQWRHASIQSAVTGHYEAVAEARSGMTDPAAIPGFLLLRQGAAPAGPL